MRLFSAFRILTLALSSLLLATTPALAKKPEKISKDLINKSGDQDVIIQFRTNADEAKHNKVRGKGGQVKGELKLIRAGVYKLSKKAIEELSDDDDVQYISPDRPLISHLQYATPAVGGAIARSNGWTGSGIGIAIIDSGVSPDTDLT